MICARLECQMRGSCAYKCEHAPDSNCGTSLSQDRDELRLAHKHFNDLLQRALAALGRGGV